MTKSKWWAKLLHLKEHWNYTQKLFLCLPQKWVKTQSAFWTAIFHDKFILLYSTLTIYIYRKTNLLVTNSTYSVSSSLEIQRTLMQTILRYKLFLPCIKEAIHKPLKVPAIELAVQGCSWEKLFWNMQQTHVSAWVFSCKATWVSNYHALALFEASDLNEVCVLSFISTITFQC